MWLPIWDELEASRRRELVDHADACPSCGPKLRVLERAEEWLAGHGTPRPVGVCPSSDDLYDFGRGPGYRRLSEPERLSIRAHLQACGECATFVEMLDQRPPAPLLYDEAPSDSLELPRRRSWPVLVAAAAAAAIVAMVLWRGLGREPGAQRAGELASARIRFPADPPLRGTNAGELWFPRERVLATAAGLWAPLGFEVAPQERATRYRITLRSHGGGAFDAGEEVLRLEGGEPLLVPEAAASAGLPAGHYTWEAWAKVDELDVPLGSRDFEIVLAPELGDELAARDSAPEPARSESILHLLHDAGFLGDARAFARSLPTSAERDAYLARRPAR